MCIVTGPNIDIAIKLIKRMKSLFEQKLGLTFTNKETVAYAWTIQDSDIHADGMCDATITVTLSNGKSFQTDTTVVA
jgi:hypothetical protein